MRELGGWLVTLAALLLCCILAAGCRTFRKGMETQVFTLARVVARQEIESAKRDLLWDLAGKGGATGAIGLLLTILGLRERQHRAERRINAAANNGAEVRHGRGN